MQNNITDPNPHQLKP